MADLDVIFDPELELATFVDMDKRSAWGPAMIGPHAKEVLTTWLDTMPFDVSRLDTDTAVGVFTVWFRGLEAAAAEGTHEAPERPVEPQDGNGLGSDAIAQYEAQGAGDEPPEPQPADTDMEADEGTSPTFVNCPLCNGAKNVVDDETGEVSACNMCAGLGVIRMAVPS